MNATSHIAISSSLKRAKRTFVAVIMSIVAAILITIGVVVCVIDYQQSVSSVRESMDVSINVGLADAESGQGVQDGKVGQGNTGNTRFDGQKANAAHIDFMPPQLGKPHDKDFANGLPIAVYTFADDTLSVVSRTRATLEESVLDNLQTKCAALPEGYGELQSLDLLYLKRSTIHGTYFAFANISLVHGWQNLAITFTLVGACALAIFFAISIAFARWALRPVEQAWQQQRRFVADASHELKTPLAIVVANTDILLDEPELQEQERIRWLSGTKDAAENMQTLVDDMLCLASLDDSEHIASKRIDSSPVNISRIVQGSVLLFEAVAFEKQVTIHESITEEIMANVSKESFQRIVHILFDNACKYVQTGGNIDVSLYVASETGTPTLCVSNTGSEIPADTLPHIFDRFYRIDDARNTKEGHGLGLSIAWALALEMNATLTAKSDSTNTEFTLTLGACS